MSELYKGTGKIVESGVYNGYRYYIRDGLCSPCAYIGIPFGHKLFQKDYDKIKIDCHCGLTFSGELRNNDNKAMEEFAIGWDYGHLGDKIVTPFADKAPELLLDGHKWTIEEIEQEIKEVINNLEK